MTTTTADQLLVLSLREFFHETLNSVLREVGLETSEETAFYLVNLLESFASAETLHGPPPTDTSSPQTTPDANLPLALLLRRAIEAANREIAIPLYRRIGDQSLYIAGFFSRSFDRERRVVSRGYYYDMGRRAYDTLSSLMERRNDTIAQVFAELSDKFTAVVEALNALSERHTFDSGRSVSDLLDRWSLAQSPTAATRLVKDGYLPLWRFEPIHDLSPTPLPEPSSPEPSPDQTPSIEVTSSARKRPKN